MKSLKTACDIHNILTTRLNKKLYVSMYITFLSITQNII